MSETCNELYIKTYGEKLIENFKTYNEKNLFYFEATNIGAVIADFELMFIVIFSVSLNILKLRVMHGKNFIIHGLFADREVG